MSRAARAPGRSSSVQHARRLLPARSTRACPALGPLHVRRRGRAPSRASAPRTSSLSRVEEVHRNAGREGRSRSLSALGFERMALATATAAADEERRDAEDSQACGTLRRSAAARSGPGAGRRRCAAAVSGRRRSIAETTKVHEIGERCPSARGTMPQARLTRIARPGSETGDGGARGSRRKETVLRHGVADPRRGEEGQVEEAEGGRAYRARRSGGRRRCRRSRGRRPPLASPSRPGPPRSGPRVDDATLARARRSRSRSPVPAMRPSAGVRRESRISSETMFALCQPPYVKRIGMRARSEGEEPGRLPGGPRRRQRLRRWPSQRPPPIRTARAASLGEHEAGSGERFRATPT